VIESGHDVLSIDQFISILLGLVPLCKCYFTFCSSREFKISYPTVMIKIVFNIRLTTHW